MKNNRTPSSSSSRDRQRVAGQQDWEVSYMTEKYGVKKTDVEEAIRAVGNSRQKVEDYLKTRGR